MKDAPRPFEPFTMAGVDGAPPRLEELVDRRALAEMIASFERLFGVPIRILSSSGSALAGSDALGALCAVVNEHAMGQRACASVLVEARRIGVPRAEPGPSASMPPRAAMDSSTHVCFTGAVYRTLAVEYDRRPIGRIVIGPYLPFEGAPRPFAAPLSVAPGEPPASLFAVDSELDVAAARAAWPHLAQADAATIDHLAGHLASVLDVILFSGHKALLTSQ